MAFSAGINQDSGITRLNGGSITAGGIGFVNQGTGQIIFGTPSATLSGASFTQTGAARIEIVVDANTGTNVIPVSVTGKATFGGTLTLVFTEFVQKLEKDEPFTIFKYGEIGRNSAGVATAFTAIDPQLTPGIIMRGKKQFKQTFSTDERYQADKFVFVLKIKLLPLK